MNLQRYFLIAVTLTVCLLSISCNGLAGSATVDSPGADEAAAASSTAGSPFTETSATEEYEVMDGVSFSHSTVIDNPYLPLQPGMQYVYEGVAAEDGEETDLRVEFTVTDLIKEIAGVPSVVTWILDYSDGELVEKEISFYAQDDDGNVWYMGEHPEEYEDGEFITAPTWIHAIADAKAGIAMIASPEPDTRSYSHGWGPAVEFSDRWEVAETGQETCVPTDCYEDVLVTDEFTTAEPNAFQTKYYAPGIGNVRVGWKGADATQEELELISLTQLDPETLQEIRSLALALEEHAFQISPDVFGSTPPMTTASP